MVPRAPPREKKPPSRLTHLSLFFVGLSIIIFCPYVDYKGIYISLAFTINRAYNDKCHKSTYWEHTYEDAMNLIAKLPTVAAIIYRNLYRDGTSVGAIDEEKDWSWNYTDMLGS